MSSKFGRGRNRVLAFATVHEQPLPLPDYCGIRDLPSVATSVTGHGMSLTEHPLYIQPSTLPGVYQGSELLLRSCSACLLAE